MSSTAAICHRVDPEVRGGVGQVSSPAPEGTGQDGVLSERSVITMAGNERDEEEEKRQVLTDGRIHDSA